jgi:hypothetical protein
MTLCGQDRGLRRSWVLSVSSKGDSEGGEWSVWVAGMVAERGGEVDRCQVRASSFSSAVPSACQKELSRAVSSGQSRLLQGARYAEHPPMTWGSGPARNCNGMQEVRRRAAPLLYCRVRGLPGSG